MNKILLSLVFVGLSVTSGYCDGVPPWVQAQQEKALEKEQELKEDSTGYKLSTKRMLVRLTDLETAFIAALTAATRLNRGSGSHSMADNVSGLICTGISTLLVGSFLEGIYDCLVDHGTINPIDADNSNNTKWEKARTWLAQNFRATSKWTRLVSGAAHSANGVIAGIGLAVLTPFVLQGRKIRTSVLESPSTAGGLFFEALRIFTITKYSIDNFLYAKEDIWGEKEEPQEVTEAA